MNDSPPAHEGTRTWLLATMAMLAAAFACYEFRFDHYFLQNDNRDALLGLLNVAYRALCTGEIGQINFHQSLGVPLLADGISSVLSPLPYLAGFLSRAIFGNEFATIDILTGIYFAIGGLGSFYLGRELGLSPAARAFGAVSWCCNPFLVFVSISWPIGPLVAFLPWGIAASLSLRRGLTPANAVAFVSAHLLLLYAGHPHWLVLGLLFELAVHLGLTAVALARSEPRAAALHGSFRVVVGLLVICVLGLPLLLPMWHLTTQSADRAQALDYAAYQAQAFRLGPWLNGVLFPFARLYAPAPRNGLVEQAAPAGLSHLGYLPLLLGGLAVVRWRRSGRVLGGSAVWLVLASLGVIALFWAWNWITLPIYFVPVLNRFRWPFKLLALANFFWIWLASRELDTSLSERPALARRTLGALAVALQLVNLVGVNIGHGQRGFIAHEDALPLVEPRAAELGIERVFTIGARDGHEDPHTAPRLGFDYASLLDLYAFAGYDTLKPAANAKATLFLNYGAEWRKLPSRLPLATLREWNVRWYLSAPGADTDGEWARTLEAAGLVPAGDDPFRRVYRDPLARPLVTWQEGGRTAGEADGLSPRYAGNALIVETDSPDPRQAVIRLLFNDFYQSTIDRAPTAMRANSLGQIEIDVPAGRHRVELRYDDPYFRAGVRIALGSLIALVAAGFIAWWKSARRRGEPATTA